MFAASVSTVGVAIFSTLFPPASITHQAFIAPAVVKPASVVIFPLTSVAIPLTFCTSSFHLANVSKSSVSASNQSWLAVHDITWYDPIRMIRIPNHTHSQFKIDFIKFFIFFIISYKLNLLLFYFNPQI